MAELVPAVAGGVRLHALEERVAREDLREGRRGDIGLTDADERCHLGRVGDEAGGRDRGRLDQGVERTVDLASLRAGMRVGRQLAGEAVVKAQRLHGAVRLPRTSGVTACEGPITLHACRQPRDRGKRDRTHRSHRTSGARPQRAPRSSEVFAAQLRGNALDDKRPGARVRRSAHANPARRARAGDRRQRARAAVAPAPASRPDAPSAPQAACPRSHPIMRARRRILSSLDFPGHLPCDADPTRDPARR